MSRKEIVQDKESVEELSSPRRQEEEEDRDNRKKEDKKKHNKKKNKKSKSKVEPIVENASDDQDTNNNNSNNNSSSSDSKKDKKKKKRKRTDAEEEETPNKYTQEDEISSKSQKKKKQKRESKRKSQQELLDMVPKKDEATGIGYTKLQIRRMMKRVKRGLPPVPTAQEEQERLRNDAQLRREEEAELAGMVYENNKEEEDDDNDDNAEESPAQEDGDSSDEEEQQHDSQSNITKVETVSHADDKNGDAQQGSSDNKTQKSKRSKAVPSDYVCQACQNKHTPRHWIYDCPNKVTVRGTNQKKKKDRGIHEPDSRKVFVSGLPFDVKPNDVCAMFEQSCGGGKVTGCKLLTFEDTKRCNGQAIVTLSSDQAAAEALKLSGTVMTNQDSVPSSKKGKDKSKTEASKPKKELKLRVTKLLNRRKTKKGAV
jgi:RNA recognition motif. (a.k.a. RRM, RBD, or RNP domain)